MLQTKEEIIEWLEKYEILYYHINDDLTIDVNGAVDLYGKGLEEIPVQFNIIGSWFRCRSNYLISLKGCPKIVFGYFSCRDNRLSSLKDGPLRVGDFYCDRNNIKSLKHLPFVYGELFCDDHLKDTKEYKAHLIIKTLRK